jgi:hypothetical protein
MMSNLKVVDAESIVSVAAAIEQESLRLISDPHA